VRAVHLLLVWLHIVAAMVWVGGTIFLAAVFVPMLRRPEYRTLAPAMLQWAGERFRKIGWATLLTLIATGTANLTSRQVVWGSAFGRVLTIKLALVGAIIALSLLHDLWIGRRATAAWRANPASDDARRLRRQASWIGRINLLLSLVVVALAVALVRGLP
jgi:uncharacterized membrane protein